jgi:hypothetical protein
MQRNRLHTLIESRIQGDLYVRFGGEYFQTCHSNVATGGRCLAYGVFNRRFRGGKIAVTTGKAVDVLKKILKSNIK